MIRTLDRAAMIARLSPTGKRVAAAILLAIALHVPARSSSTATAASSLFARCWCWRLFSASRRSGRRWSCSSAASTLSTPFVIGFANVVAAQLYGDGMSFVLVCAIVGRACARHWSFQWRAILDARHSSSDRDARRRHGDPGRRPALDGRISRRLGAGIGDDIRFHWRARADHCPFRGWFLPFLVLIAIMSVVLARTPFGRRLYAVGSNPRAAPICADLAPRRLDCDLRPERALRRGGGRAAPRLHGLGLRRRWPALSLPDDRRRSDRRNDAGRRARRAHRNRRGRACADRDQYAANRTRPFAGDGRGGARRR